MLVSDNGTKFTSTDFGNFLKKNGIHHVTFTPYDPAVNGQVEQAATNGLVDKQSRHSRMD